MVLLFKINHASPYIRPITDSESLQHVALWRRFFGCDQQENPHFSGQHVQKYLHPRFSKVSPFTVNRTSGKKIYVLLNQSIIFVYLWHDITTDINAIAIYITDLEYSKAKYPECPADNDI